VRHDGIGGLICYVLGGGGLSANAAISIAAPCSQNQALAKTFSG
jgi:MOSC domain-containing protein YiiM